MEFLEKVNNIDGDWIEYEITRGKLVRKSERILRRLSGLNQFYQNNNKLLPLTIEYIKSIEESVLDFQKRRVRHALEDKFKNEEVKVYKLAEAANLRSIIRNNEGNCLEIREYIENLVLLHNNR